MTAVTDKRALCDTATYASHCEAGGSAEISNFGGNNHKRATPYAVTLHFGPVGAVYCEQAFPPRRVAPPEVAHYQTRRAASQDGLARATRYLESVPPAIAGAHGDQHTFKVCCRVVRGFDLDDESAIAALLTWNARCEPPWHEAELRRKILGARQYGREPIGGRLRSIR